MPCGSSSTRSSPSASNGRPAGATCPRRTVFDAAGPVPSELGTCRRISGLMFRGGIAMRVGVFYFPTDYGIDVGELARALEQRGFESLFVCEHTHIPVSRRTPFPGGGELPKRYAHTHDPFVALSFAAAATRTLKVGTGIALVPQRDPIITAKEVASLDQLSGGRFIFGIGGG